MSCWIQLICFRTIKVEVMAYRKFSEEQKRMWVKKFLTRGSKSIEVFCRENVMSATALYRWVRDLLAFIDFDG